MATLASPRTGVSGASIGIDVGGTFTDLVCVDADGFTSSRKVLSTPRDQSDGVLSALIAHGTLASAVGRVTHGTTVATNALLERTGARVVLCATEGFEDLLELRRQDRASLYDLARDHPPPLIESGRTVGVPERLGAGAVRRALDEETASAVAARAAELAPRAVVVSLLHSYRDDTHERLLGRALRETMPEVHVVLASEVLPEIREYERTATATAEAYLRPVVGKYLARLAGRMTEAGYPAPEVMTSSGGVLPAAEAAQSAARLAVSGPAGGVLGAAIVARLADESDVLTIDIGGTSADVGLILDGMPLVEAGGVVAGVPIALPRVLVETVSAGGGSIGWMDDGGALRVGPRSAGAVPGPAAFGRGGTIPTVTDAHIVLGNVRADSMSGGIRANREAAEAAVARLADKLGAAPGDVARAMLAGADAVMARALRRVSVERGVDPRRCALVAFGGGGPLHACSLAEQLGMRKVLVPPLAGVLSALGLALAPERREAMASVMKTASEFERDDVSRICERLERRAGVGSRREWWARARYLGQGHELEVACYPGDDGIVLAQRFAAAHEARYGFRIDQPVQIVSLRHAAIGEGSAAILERRGHQPWNPEEPVDWGARLDGEVTGPATVALPDATMLVRPGWTATPMSIGGWSMERHA